MAHLVYSTTRVHTQACTQRAQSPHLGVRRRNGALWRRNLAHTAVLDLLAMNGGVVAGVVAGQIFGTRLPYGLNDAAFTTNSIFSKNRLTIQTHECPKPIGTNTIPANQFLLVLGRFTQRFAQSALNEIL